MTVIDPPKKGTTMATTAPKDRKIGVQLLDLDKIIVHDGFNPRTLIEEVSLNELADSIRERGLLEALGVSPVGANGSFQLISGHRRYAACQRAGVKQVPVTVRDADETERLVDAIASNLNREDLTPLDEALAFARLRKLGVTNKGIHQQLKVSEKLVADRLVLADLPPKLRDRFADRWPSGLVRIMAAMVEVSEPFGIAVADAVDKTSDANPEWAFQNLREDPVTYVGNLAESGHLPGCVKVEAVSAGVPGGAYKGGPREHASRYNALEVGAIDLAGFPPGVRTKLKALVEQSPAMARGYQNYQRYAVFLDQAVLDGLNAAKVLYTTTNKAFGICVDPASLGALVAPIIEADHAAMLKAKVKEGRTAAKGPEAQEKADEKAKAAAAVTQAREFNLQLGEQLAVHFSKVDITMDSAQLLCRMAIEGVASPLGGIRGLAERGLRYVLPQWQQEIPVKATGGVRHRYPGEGTKNPGEKHVADEAPDKLFWEWWGLAQTPQEVIGRTIQALAAAEFAMQGAVPQSRQRYGEMFSGYNDNEKKARAALRALVEPKLPKAERKRAPAKPKAAAKPKTAAAPAAPAAAATPPKAAAPAKPAVVKTTTAQKAARKDPKAKKALELIVATPGITIPQLADAMGIQQNTLYRLLPGLQKDGKITKEGRGWHPVLAAAA